VRFLVWAIAALLLAACDRPQVERIDLAEAGPAAPSEPIESPDTENALWRVAENGRALEFGDEGKRPLVTLACSAPTDGAPLLTIIRHVRAQPGAKALFAVIGNGMIARFNLDAALNENEWRWEGTLPADAPDLEIFTGPRSLEATLPGGGRLEIAGSPLPRQFVTWCRELQPEGAGLPD